MLAFEPDRGVFGASSFRPDRRAGCQCADRVHEESASRKGVLHTLLRRSEHHRPRSIVQRMVKLKYDQHAAPVYQHHFPCGSRRCSMACRVRGIPPNWLSASTIRNAASRDRRYRRGARACHEDGAGMGEFGATGDPSQPRPGMVAERSWVRRQTMVFDYRCRMEDDPEGEVRRIMLT